MLCDTKGEARKKYLVGKGLLGLTEGVPYPSNIIYSNGLARVTFCIDGDGVIRDIFDGVLQFTYVFIQSNTTAHCSAVPMRSTLPNGLLHCRRAIRRLFYVNLHTFNAFHTSKVV